MFYAFIISRKFYYLNWFDDFPFEGLRWPNVPAADTELLYGVVVRSPQAPKGPPPEAEPLRTVLLIA